MKNFSKGLYFILLLAILFSTSSPLQAQTVSHFRSLSLGSRGADVFILQQKLQQIGYFPSNVRPTGYFGLITRRAVINFQRASRLPVVGIFGPLTSARLARLYPLVIPNSVTVVSNPIMSPSQATPVPVAFQSTPPPLLPVVITAKAKTALPLYVYPEPDEKNWQTAIDAASQVDFIIANVHNGPGTEVKANWTAMIQKGVTAGIKVYGYVHTEYGKRDGNLVDTEVARWLKFYPQISGIFFDEAASGADKLSYYKARYEYVKNINPALQVVINPGTNTDEGYMQVSDINIIFESGYSSWLAKKIPAWVTKYPKERFYAIVYDVPSESEMKQVVQTAKERNFGRMFITSADGPSDPLPTYFQAELTEIAK